MYAVTTLSVASELIIARGRGPTGATVVHPVDFPILEHACKVRGVALPRLIVNNRHFPVDRPMELEADPLLLSDEPVVNEQLQPRSYVRRCLHCSPLFWSSGSPRRACFRPCPSDPHQPEACSVRAVTSTSGRRSGRLAGRIKVVPRARPIMAARRFSRSAMRPYRRGPSTVPPSLVV